MADFYNPLDPEVTKQLSGVASYGMRAAPILSTVTQSPTLAAAAIANVLAPEQQGGALQRAGAELAPRVAGIAPAPAPAQPATAPTAPTQPTTVQPPAPVPSPAPLQNVAPPPPSGTNIMRTAPGVYTESDRPSNIVNRVSSIGMRRVSEATPVAQPQLVIPTVETPDYSGAINDLLAQSQARGSSRSFDSMIAAKNQRAAAQAALREVTGMRGQDINAAAEQARLQNQALQSFAQRQVEADRFGQELGMRREEAQLNREASAAQAAGAQAMQQQRLGLDVAKALEESQRQAAAYELNVAEKERAAQQDLAKRQGLAQAYLAKTGGKLEVDQTTGQPTGRVLMPGALWGTNVDENAAAVYNSILQGVAPPATYLFPNQ